MEYRIRVANSDDAQAVHDIYGHFVEHTAVTFTEVNPDVAAYREKIQHTLEVYPFLVAESDDGAILGFAYGAQIRPHDAYLWDVEATLYLAPDAPKRQGIATALYERLIATLRRQGFKTVYGVITDNNEPSLALHRSLGFREAGRFDNMGYKHGAWHGVVWMEKRLGEFTGAPKRPIPFAKDRTIE